VHSGQQLRNVLTLRRTLVFVAVAGIVAISYKSLLEGIEQAVVWADNYNPILDVIPWLCRIGALLATAIASVVTGFIAVNSVRRERDQRTLECLLLLPVERVEILRAKWLGCVSHSVVLSCLIVGAVAVSFMMGGIGPWSALLVLLTGGVLIAFFAGFGLWLSIASKNGALANLWMALALLLTLSGGWLGLDLSPLYAQWIAGSPWSELANDGFGLRWVLASVVLFGALAGLFWKSACRRFEKMTDFGKM
jgi:ABC-type transport system involved in multi-copper enzyme maturation permease subunit